MASVSEVLSAMQEVAPAGAQDLSAGVTAELQSLTQTLLAARACAVDEVQRFNAIRERSIPGAQAWSADWLRGKTILVTGGTGCIGSVLLAHIARLMPGRLVSVSRGREARWPRISQAEYLFADITSRPSLAAVFSDVRPDVVFHLAGQRDPGLAELAVGDTVRTNVLGTFNVAAICAQYGVADLVAASTGKALRPYSREVYTATKRAAEWILARAAASTSMRVSASRFTHVVDNSIVYERLLRWADSGVVRLHDPDAMFYGQSACESAQLMLCAGVVGHAGVLRVNAISDLDFPVSLLDLAIGVLLQAKSQSPIYLSGHDPGYEPVPFPGLYDPATAGDVSPLLSAFEAGCSAHDAELGIDAFTLGIDLSLVHEDRLAGVADACEAAGDPAWVRRALDQLSWDLLDATLAAVPRQTLWRAAERSAPHDGALSSDHRRILAAILRFAQADRDLPVGSLPTRDPRVAEA